MFSRQKKTDSNFKAAKVDSIVGPQTEIQGDFYFTGGLHVDGTIKGKVVADVDEQAVLILSQHGVIEGDVEVPNVLINGTINGDVHATGRVELAPNAKINGKVYYALLEMAMGAAVNGSLIHNEPALPVAKIASNVESFDQAEVSDDDLADIAKAG